VTTSEIAARDASSSDARPGASIVMPAFNEEARLPAGLADVIAFAATLPHHVEVVVVDDGSRDRTPDIARDARDATLPANVTVRLEQHKRQQGKGAAIRTGCLAARGEYVFCIDADLATPPEEIAKLLEALRDGAPIAIGSRIQPDGSDMRASQPLQRRFVGRLFTTMRKLLRVLPDIDDTQCPMKGFRQDVAADVFPRQRLRGWIFDAEVLYIARMLGYAIVTRPVVWRHVDGSRLRVRPTQAFEVARDLIRLRFMHRREGVRAVAAQDSGT
jgi:dolichyl-phosphate beta-glucosyltransferase